MVNAHRVITGFVLGMLLLSLTGCGGVPSGQLIGTWTVDRAASSQQEKPPRNMDEWASKTFNFQDDTTLVITDGNGQSTTYVYRAPSVDEQGWMKLQVQETKADGTAGTMAPFNAAKFEGDQMLLRLAGNNVIVLTKSGS